MLPSTKCRKKQPVLKGQNVKKTSPSSTGPPQISSVQGSCFSGFPGGSVMTATRRVRDGEDSDEEWDDLSDEELKKDPSWMPAGRSSGPCRGCYTCILINCI